MTAAELVAAARAGGCILRLQGERLLYRIPPGPDGEALVCALRSRRAEVAAVLEAESEELGDQLIRALGSACEREPVNVDDDDNAAARAITRALGPDGRGGIVVRSRALGGQLVLFVRDAGILIPEKYRHLVRFTVEELRQIGRERWSADRLRAFVPVKEEFRSAEHPDEQARLVPADEAAEMRRTMIPAREWLERSAERTATAVPARVVPSLADLCDERQGWLANFPSWGPDEPSA